MISTIADIITTFIGGYMEMISTIADIITTLTIIVTIIALCMTRNQIKKDTNATIANNHLELRKLFSEQSRYTIHSNLRPGGSWAGPSGPSSQSEWIDTEDYLGIFETAEYMLQKGTLDPEMFKTTYYYRLNNIKENKVIMNKINIIGEDWEMFKFLLKRYNL